MTCNIYPLKNTNLSVLTDTILLLLGIPTILLQQKPSFLVQRTENLSVPSESMIFTKAPADFNLLFKWALTLLL
jgi:hypothetical protein